MSKMETVTLSVRYKARTEKAVKISYEDNEFWVPRSNLGYRTDKQVDELEYNQEFDCIMFEWFALKLGLI